MTITTKTAIKAILPTDPTLTDEEKGRILDALKQGNANEPEHEKVLGVREVARILDKTPKTVHYYCRLGLLKKVQFPGQSRASGILASSLDALLSGATATVA